MQMRLGFSIAAFLEPDVLLVDEALAVGDAFFQQRCLERMRDLLNAGTTLVLVSHDLAAVSSVCQRGVWLLDGEVAGDGPVGEVLGQYRRWIEENSQFNYDHGGTVQINAARVVAERSGELLRSGAPAVVQLELSTPAEYSGEVILGFSEGTAAPVFLVSDKVELAAGTTTVECRLPYMPLASGRYFVWMELTNPGGDIVVRWHPVCAFRLFSDAVPTSPVGVMKLAPVEVPSAWQVEPGATLAAAEPTEDDQHDPSSS
jgi:hypothetical protein